MFLSKLVPDLHARDVRRDLTNLYDLHRTLLRAFPDARDGGPGRVLFRVELPQGAAPFILVQSEKEPHWSRVPAGYFAERHTKPLAPLPFLPGQRLLFRLRANPTKRAGKEATDPRWVGKRVGLGREEEQENWLVRKGEKGGFYVARPAMRVIPEGKITARKAKQTLHFLSVRFEGVLEVTNPERFVQTLREGVGPAKGLGFGLLSLARAGDDS
jgi:CRISPR system Cascade subunit CasE